MQKVFTTFVLSKTAFGQLFRFFIIRGDLSDLGGVKISLSRFIVVLQSKLKMFCDQGVKYYTKTASGTQKITKVHFCQRPIAKIGQLRALAKCSQVI